MKNVLLLTDFSENSINAMRYALQLFEDDLCNFFILHVESVSAYTSDNLIADGNASLYDTFVKKSKHQLAKIIVELENEFSNKNHEYQMLVDYDVLTDAIKQVMESKNIDLIVMGTNGVTGAKEVVFGSNTINVIRKVNCPTLVIPEGFKYRKPKDILLPLDMFDSISGSAFMEVVKFVKRFSKKLHLLRINPHDKISEEEQKDEEHITYFLKDVNHDYHTIHNVPMHYSVDCYSQTHTIDLTMLIVQRETLFERFFTGSPTAQISNKIKVPLLIFHS